MNNTPPSKDEIAEVIKIFREKEQKRLDFVERYGHMRLPMVQKVGDKVFTAIEGSLYKQVQEGPYGFMNIIHDHALHFFGDAFLEVEESKPFDQRHPAIQWMHAYVEDRNNQLNAGKSDDEVDQLGVGAAWFRFAYDLHTIRDNAKLRRHFKERIPYPSAFQGIRHELRVAALCIVAGFTVEFEDETDNSRGHPEFVAIDRFSSAKIAVEAKSRHRRGVLSFESGKYETPGNNVNIRDIVKDAYQTETELPLYVFVDVNLPPVTGEEQLQEWFAEIHDTMGNLESEGYADSCPANVTFFCNDPSHYLKDRQIDNSTDQLWIMHYEAAFPKVPHPSGDMTARLKRAYTQRIAPPEDIPD